MSLFKRWAEKWKEYTEHWKGQYEEHQQEYEIAGVAVASLLVSPAVAGAYSATKSANMYAAETDAVRAATKELAQQPIAATESVRESTGTPTIGATGQIQLSENLRSWLPLGLLFIVVMYFLFKE